MDFETIKRELAERVTTRTVELHRDLVNPLAVTNVILLEELARLELRTRALAQAVLDGDSFISKDTLKSIARGQQITP